MTHKRYSVLPVLAAGLSAALVSGCGSGATNTSVSFAAGPNGLPVAAAGLVASQAQFEDLAGTKITTTGDQATYTLSGGSFSNASGAVAAEVTYNANNTITLKLGADTFVLAQSGAVFTDGTVTLVPGFSGPGKVSDSIFFFGISEADPGAGQFSESFLVTGFQTPAGEIAAKSGVISYSGVASMAARETDGTTIDNRTVIDDTVDGAISMDVNFAATTPVIDGTITGSLGSDVGTGTLSLNLSGVVSGAGFSGTISQTTANATATGLSVDNGTFSGGFFGPGGVDVGGTFRADLSGTQLAEPTTGAGSFIGTED